MYDDCAVQQPTKQDMYGQTLQDRLSLWGKLSATRAAKRKVQGELDAMSKEETELINKMNQNHKKLAQLNQENGLDYAAPNGNGNAIEGNTL